MILKRLFILACFCILYSAGFSQKNDPDFKFGNIKPEDFKPALYSIDSSADAVFLTDAGYAKYEGNTLGWFSLVYTVHKKIRLLHKKSFDDLSTVKINLYHDASTKENLDNIDAATYNLENGKVVATKVDKKSIFDEKDGDYTIKKFTFPNIQEGSIIEYTYTTSSPFYRDIPTWYFQGGYPRLMSRFTLEQPDFFRILELRQGYLQPVKDTVTFTSDNFNVVESNSTGAADNYNISSKTKVFTWEFKDVPVLKEESFITTLNNYVQKLSFQFTSYQFNNSLPKTFLSSWNETSDQLLKNEDFGADIDKANGWLKDDLKTAIGNETDATAKAKNIYDFVKSNYSCIDKNAVFLSQPLKKTQQSRKGNVSDINMLLVAMLKAAGYDANPVLLSTRDHGKSFDDFPILSNYNYVIAEFILDGKQYLLDATNPSVGFNMLPEYCYNGYGHIIAPEPGMVKLSPDSLHEPEVTTLFLMNGDDGKIEGSYKHIMNPMQSIDLRDEMKKTNTGEYFKNVKKGFLFDVDLTKETIDSLDQPEMPVSVSYNLSFKPEEDIVYFTPIIADAAYKENPFKAAQRFYPVEMPYCINETYVMNMNVPAGYSVDELPKSAKATLNGNEGLFEYLIQQSGNMIQLRCRVILNKATYEPDDYETLRNFFTLIVEKEGEQIVFKKQ